jgi:hypothetical protein
MSSPCEPLEVQSVPQLRLGCGVSSTKYLDALVNIAARLGQRVHVELEAA